MADQWGPWIEHDGKGCNCLGEYVQTRWEDLYDGLCAWAGIVTPLWETAFDWANYGTEAADGQTWGRVIRYRIRRPRGMEVLDAVLADMPEQVDA